MFISRMSSAGRCLPLCCPLSLVSSFIFITVRKVDSTSSPGLARIEQLCHDVFDLGVSSLHFLGEVVCVYFGVRPIDPKFLAATCYCYDTVHSAPPLVLFLKIVLHSVADVPNAIRYLCILRIEQTNTGPVCPLTSLRCRPAASRRRGPTMLQRCYRTDRAFLPKCVHQGPLLVCVRLIQTKLTPA